MEKRIIRFPEMGLEIEPVINMTVIRKGSSFIYQDPRYFYHKIVKENLKEFYNDETNERKALNACITLYHVIDWHCPSKEEKKKVRKEIPYGEALENIANGTKHYNKEKPYQSGRKDGTHVPEKLIVTNGKNTLELRQILEGIEKFWDSKLGGNA
jgi:cell division protein FtsI/penicillin-binding protein 2